LSRREQRRLVDALDSGFAQRNEPGAERYRADVRVIACVGPEEFCDGHVVGLCEELAARIVRTVIRHPALRERPEDLPGLLTFFMHRMITLSKWSVEDLDDRAMQLLAGYAWPGNLRQLCVAALCLVALAKRAATRTIRIDELESMAASTSGDFCTGPPDCVTGSRPESLEDYLRRHV